MANYSQLKAAIADVIKTNGTQAITGQLLQDVLNSIVSVIGANYTFTGVATPATNPGTPDQNVVYMASQAGTYTNFGGIELPAGISLLMWNGAWSSQIFFRVDDAPNAGSGNFVKSSGIYGFKDVFSKNTKTNDGLYIVDEQGKCVCALEHGNIKTKYFDSSVAPQLKEFLQGINYDLLINDEHSNVIMAIKKGHIITRKFNSENFNPWAGKNICIIGDSLTELNWYPSIIGDELECNIYNRGWSGTAIAPMSTFSGEKAYAFTHRFDLPDNNEQGNGNLTIEHSGTPSADIVDLMIVFGGTNDWGHGYIGETSSSYCPIKLGSFEEPMSDIANTPLEAGASFYAALKYTCYRAKLKYPNVPLALCTLLPSLGYESSKTRSCEYIVHQDMSVSIQEKEFLDGMKKKSDFNNAIREVAKQFGAYVIDLDKMLGFPDFSQTMAELYYNNGDMTHPSENFGAIILGKFIAKQIRNNIVLT